MILLFYFSSAVLHGIGHGYTPEATQDSGGQTDPRDTQTQLAAIRPKEGPLTP